jgi:hypothetical protein
MASLIDVAAEFGTEEACLKYLEAMRWPSGVACLKCGSMAVSKTVSKVKSRKTGEVVKTRHLYDCLEALCGFQFSATTGTIFHDTHLPLQTWFLAVALFCNAKKSLSALQLQRDLGIGSYRTAWYLAHRIRKAVEDGTTGLFTGTVEADETFVGGRYDKRRKRGRNNKTLVMGLIERNAKDKPATIRAFPIEDTSALTLQTAVRENVSPSATALYTDTAGGYRTLRREYRHATVNHIEAEYVRGDVSTNAIEGFWSLFKRGIAGQWHAISIKHLHRYLAEFTFRFNNRHAADLFNLTVARMLATIGMPYEELVSE